MASVAKFTAASARLILAHNNREIAAPSNKDIDASRSEYNYSLLERPLSDYEYYWTRKQELHCLHRDDVKTLCGWIMTAPKELPEDQQEIFFQTSYEFVAQRYGEINMVQAVVHRDESGQPHLHICFIPAIQDVKRGGEKICANDVITRRDLITFHGDWQRYLDEHGINTIVQTGITKAQGGNLTVAEMKQRRDIEHRHQQEIEHDRWAETEVGISQEIDDRGRW